MQRFETRIIFQCPIRECGETSFIEVGVPELNFSSDKFSEHHSEGCVDIVCPECKCSFEAYATCNYSECEITLDDYNQESFLGDGPMYSRPEEDDYWDDYMPPEGSYDIFGVTYAQVLALLESHVELEDDEQVFTRMIFSQLISAMEAFLSDTLITNVIGNADNTKALLLKDTDVTQQKFNIKVIAHNNNLVEETVKKYLLDILYHNLVKVQFLYRAALDIEIFEDEGDKTLLLRAVVNRHDCVHRNGYNKDGEKLELFTKVYVEEVGGAIKRMVESVRISLEKEIPF